MPQRVGEYRDRLIIQQRTETRDAAGEPSESWSEFAVRWGKRIPGGVGEQTQDHGRFADADTQFRIHMLRGVDTKMRVLAPGAVTTLSASATTATTTSLSVSDADGFPLEGEYRVRIESELVNVTAGQGTTSWTVQRGQDGTTATTHASGAQVQHMQIHDVEGAWIDWAHGAETIIAARSIDIGS